MWYVTQLNTIDAMSVLVSRATMYEHVEKNGAVSLYTLDKRSTKAKANLFRAEASYYPTNYRSGMTQVGSGFQTLQNKGRVSAAWENSTASYMALSSSLVSPHERTELAWESSEPLFRFAVAGKVWLGVLGTRIGLPNIQSTHCCFSVVDLRVM